MQHVSCDVGPELTKDIRKRVAAHCPSVLDGDIAKGAVTGGIVARRYPLGNGPAKHVGSIKRIFP